MKKRIIGAILVLVICIPILWIGGMPFIVACGIMGAFALKELMELNEHHKKIPTAMFIGSIISLSLLVYWRSISYLISLELNPGLIAITFLILFLPCIFYKDEKYTTHEAMYLFGSVLFLALFCKSLIFLRMKNIWLLVYLVFIAIFTDTFAYLIGRAIGHHKSSPRISPNKTWEGCIGGSIMGVIVSTIFYLFMIGEISIFKIVLISTLLSVVGQLGDLVFSKIKRENNIKDFSKLIPGHGGILDRVDSLVFIVLGYIFLIGIM